MCAVPKMSCNFFGCCRVKGSCLGGRGYHHSSLPCSSTVSHSWLQEKQQWWQCHCCNQLWTLDSAEETSRHWQPLTTGRKFPFFLLLFRLFPFLEPFKWVPEDVLETVCVSVCLCVFSCVLAGQHMLALFGDRFKCHFIALAAAETWSSDQLCWTQSALLSSLPSSPLSVIVSLSAPFHPNLSCPFFSHFRVFHFLSPFAFSSALQTLNSGSTQHTNAQVLASARSLTIAIYGLKDTRALEKLPLIRAYVVCQTHH